MISALDKVLKEVLPASETSFDNFLNQWCILQKNSLFGRVSSGADSLNFFSLPEQPRNSFGFIEFNSIFAESLFDFAKGVDRETFTQLEKLVITGDNFENVGRNVCLRSAQTIPKIRSGTFTAFVQAIHLIENKRDAAVEFVETELEKVDLFKGIFSTV